MPDISMCFGRGCPIREKCRRYKAEPDPYWQAYLTTEPFKDGECEMFWETR